jgi:CubicO group peptidase (beta-lactamase class C family)
MAACIRTTAPARSAQPASASGWRGRRQLSKRAAPQATAPATFMDTLGFADLPFLSLVPSLVTRAEVPEDLASVQTIDRRAEVAPQDVGLAPAAVEDIWGAALRWYRSGIHPAISICIRVRGEIVLRRSIGWSHGAGPGDSPDAKRIKATPETPFNIFSASKPMAAMVIHLLDQRHLLHLDDPVCEYIPEFTGHGKEDVTIRHVLTHRAGIPVISDTALDLAMLEDITNREAIRLLCDARPVSRAGGRLAYHAVTGGFLIGEIVRRVTGKNIRNVVADEICKPFGWRWMNYGVKAKDVEKVATSYFTGLPLVPPLNTYVRRVVLGMDFVEAVELSNDPRYLTAVLPAANLIATADELCQFYQMLMDGGSLRGRQVFEPRTVVRATAEQSYGELDFTLAVPIRYGMGFMLGGDWLSLYGFDTSHAFGHLGLTNIVAWADPERHLSAVIMTSGKPVFYPELHRGVMLVHAITNSCPKDPDFVPPAIAISNTTRSRSAGRAAAKTKTRAVSTTQLPKAKKRSATKVAKAPVTKPAKAEAPVKKRASRKKGARR